ncbi:hypothetical protein JXB41_05475 [Candidatus Woesearchaeota archaeon]|nr:hypothetical protein [Candidatus Woesearchaeota archaeon]
MIEDDDMDVLENMRKYQQKNKRSFNRVINSRDLSDDELDELFLSD